jgi:hypothetical protein
LKTYRQNDTNKSAAVPDWNRRRSFAGEMQAWIDLADCLRGSLWYLYFYLFSSFSLRRAKKLKHRGK